MLVGQVMLAGGLDLAAGSLNGLLSGSDEGRCGVFQGLDRRGKLRLGGLRVHDGIAQPWKLRAEAGQGLPVEVTVRDGTGRHGTSDAAAGTSALGDGDLQPVHDGRKVGGLGPARDVPPPTMSHS